MFVRILNSALVWPFKRQPYKVVKHIQAIRPHQSFLVQETAFRWKLYHNIWSKLSNYFELIDWFLATENLML